MKANKLAEEILAKESARLSTKSSLYQKRNVVASDIPICHREGFYSIVNWDKKKLPDTQLQARFEQGNEEERRTIIRLLECGWEVVESQKPFQIKDRNNKTVITGRIDGKIKYEGTLIPFEVKSMNPNIYSQINTMEDFKRYRHTAKYPLQMMCYLYGENLLEGMFILTDCLGHFKIITIELDYDLMESIIQKSEVIMASVASNIPPSFHDDPSVCRQCWACGILCHPPLDFGPGIEIIANEDLEQKLEKWNSLKDTQSDYEVLDKEIKEFFKDRPHSICGEYEISGKKIIKNIKAAEAKTLEYWQSKIEKIGRSK